MLQDVPDSRRGDMGEFLGGRNDYRLDIWGEAAVGVGDRALSLEIDHIAHSPDNHVDAKFAAGIYGKIVVLDDTDTLETLDGLIDYGHLGIHVEEAAFVLVDTHGDNYLVEHRQGALEDIQMAGCERVEGPGEQCFVFHIFQLIGVFPSEMRISFVFEKWRQPKNAPPASGEGWADSRT